MKKDIADKWIADLRAHPELQGRGQLQKGNKFCCLGRLCVVLEITFMPSKIWLPIEAQMAAGISAPNVKIPDHPDLFLTNINDKGATFAQIADIIEQYWEDL